MFSDTNDDGSSPIESIDSTYTSRVAEIFNVTLRSLGISIDFVDDEDVVKTLDDDTICQHNLNGHAYMCTDYQFYLIKRTDEIRNEILAKTPIMTESRLKELTEQILRERKYINGPLNTELGNLAESVDAECKKAYEELIDSIREEVEKDIEEPEEEELSVISK